MIYILAMLLFFAVIYVACTLLTTILIRLFDIRILKELPREQGVLLTFDDGPHPVYTPQLLDLLQENQIKAIFFVVGELAERHPKVIQRMHEEGHEIGIHHYRHESSWLLTPRQLKRQLVRTEEVITSITKQQVSLYRPPWGHFNLASLFIAKKYQTIMWSHIYKDWLVDKHKLDSLRASPPRDGSIILLHDNGETAGADQKAPEIMLTYLAKYIYDNKRRNIPFIDPRKCKERDV